MDKTWDQFFQFLMKWEGTEFENDPSDNGGATKFGIDARSHPGLDIKNLTIEDAKEIYRREYNQSFASRLPYPFNFEAFDATVNTGENRSTKIFQKALGVTADGIWGVQSMAAFINQEHTNPRLFSDAIAERNAFYRSIAHGKLSKYLKGWLNRTADLKAFLLPNYEQSEAP